MKTNVINGAFVVGQFPVDTGVIRIADPIFTEEGITFQACDGIYTVVAATDENGIIIYLGIDVSKCSFIFAGHEITEINEKNIIIKNGELGKKWLWRIR